MVANREREQEDAEQEVVSPAPTMQPDATAASPSPPPLDSANQEATAPSENRSEAAFVAPGQSLASAGAPQQQHSDAAHPPSAQRPHREQQVLFEKETDVAFAKHVNPKNGESETHYSISTSYTAPSVTAGPAAAPLAQTVHRLEYGASRRPAGPSDHHRKGGPAGATFTQPFFLQEEFSKSESSVDAALDPRTILLVKPTSLSSRKRLTQPILPVAIPGRPGGILSTHQLAVRCLLDSKSSTNLADVAGFSRFMKRYWRCLFFLSLIVAVEVTVFSLVPALRDAIREIPHDSKVHFTYLNSVLVGLMVLSVALTVWKGAFYPYSVALLIWMHKLIGTLTALLIAEYFYRLSAKIAHVTLVLVCCSYGAIWMYSQFKLLQCKVRLQSLAASAAPPSKKQSSFQATFITHLAPLFLSPTENFRDGVSSKLSVHGWSALTAFWWAILTSVVGALTAFSFYGTESLVMLSAVFSTIIVGLTLVSAASVTRHVSEEEHRLAVLFGLFPWALGRVSERAELRYEVHPPSKQPSRTELPLALSQSAVAVQARSLSHLRYGDSQSMLGPVQSIQTANIFQDPSWPRPRQQTYGSVQSAKALGKRPVTLADVDSDNAGTADLVSHWAAYFDDYKSQDDWLYERLASQPQSQPQSQVQLSESRSGSGSFITVGGPSGDRLPTIWQPPSYFIDKQVELGAHDSKTNSPPHLQQLRAGSTVSMDYGEITLADEAGSPAAALRVGLAKPGWTETTPLLLHRGPATMDPHQVTLPRRD